MGIRLLRHRLLGVVLRSVDQGQVLEAVSIRGADMIGYVIVSAVISQVDGHPFWDTPLGILLSWAGAICVLIAALAGGIAGIRAIYKTVKQGTAWGKAQLVERQRQNEVMEEMLSAEGWPNGAKSLPESHRHLYEKVKDTREDVAEIKMSVKEIQRVLETGTIP